MNLLIRSIHLATGVLATLGIWGLYLGHRPTSIRDALTAFASDVPDPTDLRAVIWVAVALAAGIGWRRLAARQPRMERMQAPTPPAAALSPSEPVATLGEVTGTRREHDRRRIRLEAFLRARPDVPTFVDELLGEAVRAGASDLHLRPTEHTTVCDLRRRGELAELVSFPTAHHEAVVRRIKILADLVPYITDRPQDGRLQYLAREADGSRRDLSVRVAVVPSSRGEKVTLRLAGDARARSLDTLGWTADDRQRFEALLSQPQGMIVLTGPTGCGKTTTLYSALGHLHAAPGGRALASIEDPVEVDLPFVQQTAVDRARGLGFADALRAILRQDPDVLMVGEIRDPETARIAVQAALSGHLLLTTLHADSALGVFPRLIDLEVEPFLVGSATLACVAQRLVPRLCRNCRHPSRVAPELRRRAAAIGLPEEASFFAAEGCGVCGDTGFDGRTAVFEILRLDAALRRRIAAREDVDSLRAAAHEAGHRSLADAALDAARRGEITLRDALSMLGKDPA